MAKNQTIQPYVKSTQLFQCPSDPNANNPNTAWWVTPGAPAFPKPFHTSYVHNSYATGMTDATMVNPTQTVLMTDGGLMDSTAVPFITATTKPMSWALAVPECGPMSSPTNEDWSVLTPRHLGTSVVAFADGHAKAMQPEKWFYTATPWLNPAIGGS